MMNEAAIKEIEQLTLNAQIKKDKNGNEWVREHYKLLNPIHEENVIVSSLESFCDFIKTNPNGLDFNGAFVLIRPDFTVELLSKPKEEDKQRTTYMIVKPYGINRFQFGQRYDVEDFVIALKTQFIRGEAWDEVFNLVRKIQIDEGVTLEDDGMTQKVTVKNGVSAASLQTKDVKTDYVLIPWRIYSECKQPASIFFVRISGNKDVGVHVSLYETDGGAWKVEAAKNIADYLNEQNLGLPVLF